MDKFIVQGGARLQGEIRLTGAKNVALKACVAALLTDEEVILHNIPNIRDVRFMLELIGTLGISYEINGYTVRLKRSGSPVSSVPLEIGARLRTSSLVIGPLLARFNAAVVPNPGGCRIGARPINRHIEALRLMGASIDYDPGDGNFHGSASGLHGAEIEFSKNTHTGTEAIILAAVLARGRTVIKNAAEEVEVEDLIRLLTSMGAVINRVGPREIHIEGVKRLGGTEYTIMYDRNEEVTFAVAAAVTGGSIAVRNSQTKSLEPFMTYFRQAGGIADETGDSVTVYSAGSQIHPTDITTKPHPGFMTDWQGPWAVYMTQADGISTIHETVFESRFAYVAELKKMGAHIDFFQPVVKDPEKLYNFNRPADSKLSQAIRIKGPTRLHDAVLEMHDLRAGATLLIASLITSGRSYIHGIEHIDRGYENIEKRLGTLGAKIVRTSEEDI